MTLRALHRSLEIRPVVERNAEHHLAEINEIRLLLELPDLAAGMAPRRLM